MSSNSGDSRPGLISDDSIAQNREATGRGTKNVPRTFVVARTGNATNSNSNEGLFHVERVPYPLYDDEQHLRAKIVCLALGIFGAVVVAGAGVLTLITLAGKPGELVSGFLLTALVPLSALVTGIGGYFFGHKAGREILVRQQQSHDAD